MEVRRALVSPTLRLLLQLVKHGVVGRLLLVVVVPHQRSALTREDARDPRVLVDSTL